MGRFKRALFAGGRGVKGQMLKPSTIEQMWIKLEVRYATTNNFLGSVFYSEPRAFLHRQTRNLSWPIRRSCAAFSSTTVVPER
jgi:hypothetical protein